MLLNDIIVEYLLCLSFPCLRSGGHFLARGFSARFHANSSQHKQSRARPNYSRNRQTRTRYVRMAIAHWIEFALLGLTRVFFFLFFFFYFTPLVDISYARVIFALSHRRAHRSLHIPSRGEGESRFMNRKFCGAFLKTIIGILDAHRAHVRFQWGRGGGDILARRGRANLSRCNRCCHGGCLHPNASLALPLSTIALSECWLPAYLWLRRRALCRLYPLFQDRVLTAWSRYYEAGELVYGMP